MQNKLNQRGFGVVGLLIILGLVIIGGGAFWYLQNKSATTANSALQTVTNTERTHTSPSAAPSATIDKNSLITNSLTPTLTGTATGLSEVAIDVLDLSAEPAAGSQYVTHDSAPVINGHWSDTLVSSPKLKYDHTYGIRVYDDPAGVNVKGTLTIGKAQSVSVSVTCELNGQSYPNGTKQSITSSSNGGMPITDPFVCQDGQWLDVFNLSGMSLYTDSNFGFSFWYPSGWKVRQLSGKESSFIDTGAEIAGNAGGGEEGGYELTTATGKNIDIVELNSVGRAIHVGNEYYGYDTYYFDTATHTWMDASTDAANGNPNATTTANVSNNTMGGLHIFSGGARFGASSLVPLSAQNFLLISTSDIGGTLSQNPIVQTILATDPSVATPVSAAQQTATIQAEKDAYAGQ
jgi:hypothetical protein